MVRYLSHILPNGQLILKQKSNFKKTMDWYINTIKNIYLSSISFWPHFNQTHNIQRWKRFVCVIWITFALKHWIQRLLCRHVYMYIETLAFSVNMQSESILMLMMMSMARTIKQDTLGNTFNTGHTHEQFTHCCV